MSVKYCADCHDTEPPHGFFLLSSGTGRFSKGDRLCGPCRDKARGYGSGLTGNPVIPPGRRGTLRRAEGQRSKLGGHSS